MRVIKFRGKSLETNDWIYGSLIYSKKEDQYYIVEHCGEEFSFAVNKDTIGQYVGSNCDVTNDEIYEGDILNVTINNKKTICTVNYADNVGHFQLWQLNTLKGTSSCLNLGNYHSEKLGNIYDNKLSTFNKKYKSELAL